MKFGQQLEHESVPEWSYHNLDYNSLKHEIKVQTTRDQATAIAIPGHQDAALKKFEDRLYNELCLQHERVELFITSKADEISRRLDHVASKLQRWISKHADANGSQPSLKHQRLIAKYERELLRCGEETHGLSRFSNAQVVAFRKILKKYRKWTGSTTLTSRFNQNVLSGPKSFTKRNFNDLQLRYDQILGDLRAATPHLSEPSSPETDEQRSPDVDGSTRPRRVSFEPLPPAAQAEPSPSVKYWNEYDYGSDQGGDDEYAIYVNPDEDVSFPGIAYVKGMMSGPYDKVKQWFWAKQLDGEVRPLLGSEQSSMGYSSTAVNTDSEEEGYASSDGIPQQGYATHFALPSVSEQRVARYREKVLLWGTTGCFVGSYALLAIASTLIATGKHKLRVEVDAGVTVGVMLSLFAAGSGLGMTLYRRDNLPIVYWTAVWVSFVAACILNGMLLVLVLGNTP